MIVVPYHHGISNLRGCVAFLRSAGTGSPFHHAAVYNMFYQVHGKKQWYFIDPYDTFLAYPLSVVGTAANALMVLWPDQYNKKVL